MNDAAFQLVLEADGPAAERSREPKKNGRCG
jgi:hypothetical protein